MSACLRLTLAPASHQNMARKLRHQDRDPIVRDNLVVQCGWARHQQHGHPRNGDNKRIGPLPAAPSRTLSAAHRCAEKYRRRKRAPTEPLAAITVHIATTSLAGAAAMISSRAHGVVGLSNLKGNQTRSSIRGCAQSAGSCLIDVAPSALPPRAGCHPTRSGCPSCTRRFGFADAGILGEHSQHFNGTLA